MDSPEGLSISHSLGNVTLDQVEGISIYIVPSMISLAGMFLFTEMFGFIDWSDFIGHLVSETVEHYFPRVKYTLSEK